MFATLLSLETLHDRFAFQVDHLHLISLRHAAQKASQR